MLELFGVFLAVLAVVNLWGMWCNYVTYLQRHALIDAVYDGPEYRTLIGFFRAVSYERHLLALMLFKNPLELYGVEIATLFPSGRIEVRS